MGKKEMVQYIRDNFEKKYAENIACGMYDARDLARLQNDAIFVHSYIRGEDRLDEGVDLVHTSLKFRKEIKINDLSEDSFDAQLFERGGMYFHGKDISGHRILWLKVKIHRKDVSPERLHKERQVLMFALEEAFNKAPLHQVVVLMDMTACGLANLDMDFVKFIITIFKFYYPTFLAYLLIYDMPWIFNAAWKVIKAWLSPEAVAKIKFVTKADIQTYIKSGTLPPYMGGMDSFEYVYRPGMAFESLNAEDEDRRKEKRVHFQEVQEYSSKSTGSPTGFASDSSSVDYNANMADGLRNRTNNNHSKRANANNSAIDKKRSLVLGRSQSSPNISTYVGRLLTVSPADELTFQSKDGGDAFDIITLTNTLPFSVAYKVKTTSPEKFRVRPSAGIIKPDKSEEVYVYLVPDYMADVQKDKFLIMAMEVLSETGDPNQMFKDAPKDKIMQHKLKCSDSHGPLSAVVQEVANVKIDPFSTKFSEEMQDRHVLGTINSTHPKVGLDRRGSGNLTHIVPRTHDPSVAFVVPPATAQPVRRLPSSICNDEIKGQMEQLEAQIRHMQRQLNLLLAIQFLTAITLILIILSYSCFGEDLFTRYLALPFEFCNDRYGRKC